MATDMRTRFLDGVRRAAEGTPYRVDKTPDGFDVRVDVTEPRWTSMLRQQQTRFVFTHHVRMESDETYTITDEQLRLSWEAGDSGGGPPRPVLSASAVRSVGRHYTYRRRKAYGLKPEGGFGEVVDFRFRSKDGHDLIRSVASDLHLNEEMPKAMKTGLAIGIAGVVLALVAMAAAAVVILIVL
jgi:hypothetical protein